MSATAFIIAGIVLACVALFLWRLRKAGRPVPGILRSGQPLPEFAAFDEQGAMVSSSELQGAPAVLLFVRGNWCPFCTSQVKNLSVYYKDIVDLGARLILVTPKPLETTKRVAEFFDVDFDFWLDSDLTVTRQLGLLQEAGVPKGHREEYGEDTVWPTALVVDPAGIIRFVELSKFIADRPNPKTLLQELKAAVDS